MRFKQYFGFALMILALATLSMGQGQTPPGASRTKVYTANLGPTSFVCAAVTCDATIRITPVRAYIQSAIAKIVTPFTCANTAASQTIAVGATAGTFTRSAGNFQTDGFAIGMQITSAGYVAGGDNVVKIIQTVTATVITVTSNAGLVDEAGTGDETISTCTTATLSMTGGKSAGGNQYLLSFDIDAAAAVFGDADGELGASLTKAGAPTQFGDYLDGSTTLQVRATSGTRNLGSGTVTNLTAGAVSVYIVATELP